MSVLNAKGIADETGISKYKIWRWLTGRSATITAKEKDCIINIVASELNEIKKR